MTTLVVTRDIANLKKKHDAFAQETKRTDVDDKVLDFRYKKKRKFGRHSNQGTPCNPWGSKFRDNGELDKPG